MLRDMHIHIERGEYTDDWINKFVDQAVKQGIDEINLLEHSIRIKEFHPTFEEARNYNLYQKRWFDGKQNQAHTLDEYKMLVDKIRSTDYPIKVNFGLEVCWFEQHSDYIKNMLKDNCFDFVFGSVHWIDNWTFNQRKYQWLGKDVDKIYKRYFELNNSLISSDIFDAVAHPYLIKCHGIYPSFDLKPYYIEMFQNAKAHNVAVELNGSQIKCIDDDFIFSLKQSGAKAVTGSDAHCPEDVGKNIEKLSIVL